MSFQIVARKRGVRQRGGKDQEMKRKGKGEKKWTEFPSIKQHCVLCKYTTNDVKLNVPDANVFTNYCD